MNGDISFLEFALPLALAYFLTPVMAPRLKQRGIKGRDLHRGKEVAEMGGLVLFLAYMPGVMLALFFLGPSLPVIASLLTAFLLTLLGVVDDLLGLPKTVKALLPLFASIPLVVLRQGETRMVFPLIGPVDLGPVHTFLLVPLGISVAANLANMVEGINGLASGLGLIYYSAFTLLAFLKGKQEIVQIFLPFLGALLGFFFHNSWPAEIFPGDTGTFLIGGLFAAGAIAGNLEAPAGLLFLPFLVDFTIKLLNGFPSRGWEAVVDEQGRLKFSGKVNHVIQLVLKFLGPLKEWALLSVLMAFELLWASLVVLLWLT